MKLSFLILAHDRPEQAAELALTLVGAARDATAFIHFDVRARPADFAALKAAVRAEPRIRLVAKRAAGRWGSFGLVEAPLNALMQMEAEGVEPDYVTLLSGACLPCRPVASLERFLVERDGGEFIESEDESWITGGWRAERWRYWHLFDHKTQRPLEAASARIQKALGVRRRFPQGLEPRFGSQWWTLSWPVLQAILADVRRQPKRLDFFRSVWIPDEMVFQTWVNALVPREAIAGFSLTHFQFTNRGKPIVFHDDHAGYVGALGRFFVRKVSPEATRLRAACLARASAPDDGRGLGAPQARRHDYKLKVAAQTHYPRPGQIFYADQFVTMSAPVLARAEGPYVVLAGPPALTAAAAAELPRESFTVFGEVFAPGEVGLGAAGDGEGGFQGLDRGDVAIRDMHPALWLVRLRARARGVPVLTWSPANHRQLLAHAVRDPKALLVTLPPSSGDPDRDRAVLIEHCLGPTRAAAERLGVAPERFRAALADRAAPHNPDMALWLVTGAPGAASPDLRPPDVELPWSPDPGRAAAAELGARRREALARALAACRFRDAPWFPELAAALERAAARLAEAAARPAVRAGGAAVLEDAS